MDRQQKKAIHLRITQLLDSHCKGCEFRSIYNSHLHCNTNCSIGKELAACSSRLLDKSAINEYAEEYDSLQSGLWTKEEEFYLINHANLFKIEHLAQRLNRTHGAVYNKIRRFEKAKVISKLKRRKVSEDGLSG
jgi:hypothetical protein